ncbi:MAG: DUF1801 domain-containing protein [Acidobacteriota bacterium]
MTPITDPKVAAVFDRYPSKARKLLLEIRELIFETARATEGVGEVEEALRWGEPAYLTPETKSGSTIRIDWKEATPNLVYVYFHCHTTLIETFRAHFSEVFSFQGNRSLSLELEAKVPREPLSICLAEALTYHRNKRSSGG